MPQSFVSIVNYQLKGETFSRRRIISTRDIANEFFDYMHDHALCSRLEVFLDCCVYSSVESALAGSEQLGPADVGT